MWSDFHFLNPWWLVALVPLTALLWLSARRTAEATAWRRVIDEPLLNVLTLRPQELGARAARWPFWLLGLAWSIAVLALANPTFERKPVPTYSGGVSRVVVLDLSQSMLASDLTPSRLARARYKVADILARVKDGRVGLVAFAGDAFTVAPLTQDAETIVAMSDALKPEIMPVQGSRPDLALERAASLLTQAGAQDGEVVLLTDDAGDTRARDAARALRDMGHRLAVIGAGTVEGAPVPGVRRAEGPVMARLDPDALRALARAGGGAYAPLSADDRDLEAVLTSPDAGRNRPAVLTENQAQAWYPLGPWIALALLPLGALAFRRGWLAAAAPVFILSSITLAPQPAQAFGWQDLWLRQEQQAAQALEQQDLDRALELAEDPQRRGTAAYRKGDYQAAAKEFAAGHTATAHYNRGNALARAGALEEALSAYDQALKLEPDHQDARHNRAAVEDLLQQQEDAQRQSGGQQQNQQGEGQEDQPSPGQDGAEGDAERQQGGEGQDPGQQDASAGDAPSQSAESSPADDRSGAGGGQRGERTADAASKPEQSDRARDAENAAQDQQGGEEQPPSAAADASDEHARGAADSDRAAQGREDAVADVRDPEAEEQAAEDYRAAAQAAEGGEAEPDPQAAGSRGSMPATPDDQEARAAADQWLRRIPDDPAGLLRRKFLYQYGQRVGPEQDVAAGEPW